LTLTSGNRVGANEILAPIGAGGMGEVCKARDTQLNRIVAIKRLRGQHTARFEQEARAIAALNAKLSKISISSGSVTAKVETCAGKSNLEVSAIGLRCILAALADARPPVHGVESVSNQQSSI
jgi:serine/threonine protein kinase